MIAALEEAVLTLERTRKSKVALPRRSNLPLEFVYFIANPCRLFESEVFSGLVHLLLKLCNESSQFLWGDTSKISEDCRLLSASTAPCIAPCFVVVPLAGPIIAKISDVVLWVERRELRRAWLGGGWGGGAGPGGDDASRDN